MKGFNMIIIAVAFVTLYKTDICSTDSSFMNKINTVLGTTVRDKSIFSGTFKTAVYLGSVTKVSCFGIKRPTQVFRQFSWYHMGKRISNNNHFKINKNGVLTIYKVTVEDSGEFLCRAKNESGVQKFKHDVAVLQIPSKSLHVHFVYVVRDCTPKTEEFASRFIQSKVEGKVCLHNECNLSYVHSRCHFEWFANPSLKVTVPVVLPGIPNGSCNVDCLWRRQDILKEEVKQRIISAVIHSARLKTREEPQEMAISYLETDENTICNPGFEIKGPISKSLCIPCSPGHFLEKGYCIPCHLNQYNGKYAATECRSCFGRRVTRERGATSEDECYVADPEVLWVFFAILIIILPFLLTSCCWGVMRYFEGSFVGKCLGAVCLCKCFKRKGTSNSNENKELKNPKPMSGERIKSHGRLADLNKSSEFLSSLRKARAANSFENPSVRRTSGKDFFYEARRPATKIGIIPPPPALPTDSMLKQASRDMTYAVIGVNKGAKSAGLEASNRTRLSTVAGNTNTSENLRDEDISHFSNRILKNIPTHNAIKKLKV